ncbi:abscisic acid 8'-hydroxylase 4-like isoform X1 [Andrographis paniculata]|uniref:abscisic acid 8'-hydroxylase 4-like isoform X1 n=1 Tax=Andrographis paniculata TaxID=175694 RepID=UPI0021E89F07|nr:abscisic acid 8'-hydroxylase 4-like isoform X1 [Andrographis paniculata]
MDKIFSTTILYILLCLSTLVFYHVSKKRIKNRKHTPNLPPGTMGWPYVGETLQLYSKDPDTFFSDKQKRYGDIFKTNILGCPCVMLASPEASKFILATNADLFKPTYPKSKEKMIGPMALFFHQGEYHSNLKKLVQTSFSPKMIKKLIPKIESICISILDSWVDGQVINTFREMKRLSFEVGILAIFGQLEKERKDELHKNYVIVDKGYNSFPTNLIGTPYYKALQARKRLNEILREIICERKKMLEEKNLLLGQLIEFKDVRGVTLSDDQISDNIIGVLFAAQDTTAAAITWILKYLHDHPKLLEAVKVAPRANTFMPFGSGAHSCPGNELAKLEILIFIHHLLNKMRWEVVGPQNEIQYSPFPIPQNGLPARFWREPEDNN